MYYEKQNWESNQTLDWIAKWFCQKNRVCKKPWNVAQEFGYNEGGVNSVSWYLNEKWNEEEIWDNIELQNDFVK